MNIRCFLMLLFLVIYPLAQAATNSESQKVTSLEDFLKIVEERAPEIQLQVGELKVSEKSIKQASQFLNPDVSIGSWRGEAGDQTWKQTDISILQPIELGGKRSGRIQLAKANTSLAKSSLNQMKSQVRVFTLLSLHRLRQVIFEKSLIEEAQEAFEKLVRNYKKRPQLSPEQNTSLFLFQMAKRDYDLKRTEIDNEQRSLSIELKKMSNMDLNDIIPILPQKIIEWPEVESSNKILSPSLDILRAQKEVSKFEYEVAKSESWPTPSIGPSFTNQSQFGEKASILGIMFTTKLPILNLNGGGRAASRENLYLSEKSLNLEENKLSLDKNNLLENYKSQVLTLNKSNVDGTIHTKHQQIESYFLKGLINSSLVIETHRQIFDSQKSYHQSELSALENYYQIRIFDGTFFEGAIL